MSVRRKCLGLILPNFDTTIESLRASFTHDQQEGECSNQKYYRDTSAEEKTNAQCRYLSSQTA